MSRVKLYSYWRSSSSYRVRISLHHKQIDFETIAVNLLESQQDKKDYVLKNPMGQVPALVVGDQVINQSMIILRYLEDHYPKPSLMADDKYLMLELCEIINSGIQPLQNLSVLKRVSEFSDKKTWAKSFIEKGLKSFVNKMPKAGEFCMGNKVSLADVVLIPQIYSAKRFDIDFQGLERLLEIEARCLQLEAFQKACPENQKDAQL